ncbi:glycosyltransferase family 2 protein [Bacillus paranthracis]|uniref:glycosyltransferase family 2 protein n=1 Tax=Bacillus cereus group TaxID=86661 RepID=UPI0022E25452|nr:MULTISPECIES: glycosyltransferase family 2 protein [Bacillus cereus group]MDA1891116.1 glycosyltransferase family 2 protein [Bacillus cereus group sp. BY11-1LC]MDA2592460.1 glycosyltransferase family 2 protein [Bacillus cereus group sp. Bc065]MDK7441955.1 glycosyltransferase family 2 protein [Bacillus paranthracis]MDK7458330.1 glycosyltransferase family 2 protein [Bacillus paranthracis]
MDFQKEVISIIMPNYNSIKFIRKTIESVIDQSYYNWELIVIDDGSSDGSIQVIKEFQRIDKRIKLEVLGKNSGAAIARNTGISMASGRYIAFLDSDDLWVPRKLEKQLNFMKENNVAFSFTGYEIITESGEKTGKIIHVPKKIDYQGLLKNTIIGCLTVMIDTQQVGKIQMPNLRTRQDTATWLSILKRGFEAYGIDEVLSKYRKVENSISSKKIKMARMNWKLYREVEGLSVFKSAWCFINYAYNGFAKHLIK